MALSDEEKREVKELIGEALSETFGRLYSADDAEALIEKIQSSVDSYLSSARSDIRYADERRKQAEELSNKIKPEF